jgi:hypothetical protein
MAIPGRVPHRRRHQLRRALSQPNAFALGALAGGARIREVVTSAGCSRFRRAAQTPFNLVFEARP